MSRDKITHALSFAVRFNNHFTGEAIADELPVRLSESYQRPVARADHRGYRQIDGDYRFINAPAGHTKILWRPAFTYHHAGWVSWANDVSLDLPLADPSQLIAIELWPTGNAPLPATATAIRGRLVGANNAQQLIRIARDGEAFDRYTKSDSTGHFLFRPPGRLDTNTSGVIPFVIEVRALDTTLRSVSGGEYVPASGGPVFTADTFLVKPNSAARVNFFLS